MGHLRPISFLLAFLCMAILIIAQDARTENNPDKNLIMLKRKTINVEKEYAPFVGRKKQAPPSESWIWSKPLEAEQIMVHYSRRISADDHFNVESIAGVGSVLAYIPTNTYLVQIPRVCTSRRRLNVKVLLICLLGLYENYHSGIRWGTSIK